MNRPKIDKNAHYSLLIGYYRMYIITNKCHSYFHVVLDCFAKHIHFFVLFGSTRQPGKRFHTLSH